MREFDNTMKLPLAVGAECESECQRYLHGSIVDADGEEVASLLFETVYAKYTASPVNAATIVKCVNAHDGLVSALQAVRAYFLRNGWEKNSIMIEGIDKPLLAAQAHGGQL